MDHDPELELCSVVLHRPASHFYINNEDFFAGCTLNEVETTPDSFNDYATYRVVEAKKEDTVIVRYVKNGKQYMKTICNKIYDAVSGRLATSNLSLATDLREMEKTYCDKCQHRISRLTAGNCKALDFAPIKTKEKA